jgi:hypothetical protein
MRPKGKELPNHIDGTSQQLTISLPNVFYNDLIDR